MPLRLTPLLQKRLTRRAQAMIESSLAYFPELDGKTITIGYTRKHLGSATVVYRNGMISQLVIRLKIRKLSFQTIGHELTHLVQGLERGERRAPWSVHNEKIPSGEKQCDIWTLARDRIFCDDAPTYIRLPRLMRDQWPAYAEAVRGLCIAAIEKRKSQRLYIRWLEAEIRRLPRRPPEKISPEQLELPFGRG
jgi:hypothetical protein